MKTIAGHEDSRRWYQYWPLLLIAIETILNTDWVITPILMKRGLFFDIPFIPISWDLTWLIPELGNFKVFLIICMISVPTTLAWYWLWGWMARVILETAKEKESVKEALSLVMSMIEALKRGGLIELVKDWFISTFNWATDNDNRWLKYLRRGGYTALFVVSALPVSGARLVATIFCRSVNSRKGMVILIAGESVKNALIVYGFWNLIFWLFS